MAAEILTAPASAPSDFQELASFAPVMIWRAGTDGRRDWFNGTWLDFVGRSIEQEVGRGWAEGVHPNDYGRCVDVYSKAFDDREPFSIEYRLRRQDGVFRWLLDNGSPFWRSGAFAGYLGSCVDVSSHKELEANQQSLINELNHRVKNMLSTVQSMAAQSFRDLPAAHDMFTARLVSLGRTHDLLSRQMWKGTPIGSVVAEAVLLQPAQKDAVTLSGPTVVLQPKAALMLSIMITELAANAARFGAFSSRAGRVAITWTVNEASPGRFEFRWEERSGPLVETPQRHGFGTRLSRQFGREFGGDVTWAFEQGGVVFTAIFPLANIAAAGESADASLNQAIVPRTAGP